MADVVCLYGVLLVIMLMSWIFPTGEGWKPFSFYFFSIFLPASIRKGDLSSVVNLQGKDKLHELIGNKVLNAQLKGKKMAFDGKFVLDNSGSP